jgi:rare lipoprotein A
MRYVRFFTQILNYLIIKKQPSLFLSYSLLLILFPINIFAQSDQNIGNASYYSNKFQGKKTASGEKYDQHKYTAAHRSLPFGTKLKVTNLKNGNHVIVTVNDRGPFSKNRLIDVSFIAAKSLDMIRDGVIQVKIEEVNGITQPVEIKKKTEKDLVTGFYTQDLEPIHRPKGYLLQLGSFSTIENAKERIQQLYALQIGTPCIEKVIIKKKELYRVLYSGFSTKTAITAEQKKLNKKGISSIILPPK